VAKSKIKKKQDELTEEQHAKLLEDLDNFDMGFFSALAETDNNVSLFNDKFIYVYLRFVFCKTQFLSCLIDSSK
jgi:hypothetical protein